MSRVLSPPDDRPSTYDKFVMDKDGKYAKYIYPRISWFPNLLLLENINPDRKELILDKEREILSLKLRDFLS